MIEIWFVVNGLQCNSGFQPFQYHQLINVWSPVYLGNCTHHFWQFLEPPQYVLKFNFSKRPYFMGDASKGQGVELSGTVPETKSVFYLNKPLPSVIEPNILDTAVVLLSGLKNSFWGKGVQYNES